MNADGRSPSEVRSASTSSGVNAVRVSERPSSMVRSGTETVAVLVVEDNHADARYLDEVLAERAENRFVCEHATDLASARDALAAARFDVILLDLSLPDGGGVVTVEEMRRVAGGTPIVVLTGLRGDPVAISALQAGAQDYLIKGADAETVARSIRYAIERRKAENEAALRARAEQSAHHARFLAEASRVLAESQDVDTTLRAFARLTLPILGDYCFVDLVEGEEIRRVICEHVDEEKAADVQAAMQYSALRTQTRHPAIQAITSGKPILHDARDPEVRRWFARDEEHERAIERLNPGASLTVPLRVRGRVLGALTLVRNASRPPHEPDDLVLAEDLASRGALAVENARALQSAREAALARQEIIGVVSHDLRNPISVVSLTLKRMRGMPDVVQRVGAESLDRADRALARTTHLLDDLLQIATIEAGALQVRRKPVALRELVSEAIDLHRPLADAKKLELRARIDDGLEALSVDRERIGQVFANLIGNALKFTPVGGSIIVSASNGGERVVFAVQDDGPGIPPESVARLFDRFYRVPGVVQPGTGLGLAIARGIVEAHRGTIWCESSLGRGTRMCFAIPVR